jgi:hypothetical protein
MDLVARYRVEHLHHLPVQQVVPGVSEEANGVLCCQLLHEELNAPHAHTINPKQSLLVETQLLFEGTCLFIT